MKLDRVLRATAQTLLIAALCASLGCAANVAPEASGDTGEKQVLAGAGGIYIMSSGAGVGAGVGVGACFASGVCGVVLGVVVIAGVAYMAMQVDQSVYPAVTARGARSERLTVANQTLQVSLGSFAGGLSQASFSTDWLGIATADDGPNGIAAHHKAYAILYVQNCRHYGGGTACIGNARAYINCVSNAGGASCGEIIGGEAQFAASSQSLNLAAAASFELCCRKEGGGVAPTASYGDWNACTEARRRLPPQQQSSCYCAVAGNCP